MAARNPLSTPILRYPAQPAPMAERAGIATAADAIETLAEQLATSR